MGASGRPRAGYERRDRVKDLIFRETALIISEGRAADPRLLSAVVTDVSLSRDLSSAKIYFTGLKGAPSASTVRALNRLSGFFRKQIASRLNLRKVPTIEFKADEVLRSARRVEEIIRREKI